MKAVSLEEEGESRSRNNLKTTSCCCSFQSQAGIQLHPVIALARDFCFYNAAAEILEKNCEKEQKGVREESKMSNKISAIAFESFSEV